jgi:hypothetical protein
MSVSTRQGTESVSSGTRSVPRGRAKTESRRRATASTKARARKAYSGEDACGTTTGRAAGLTATASNYPSGVLGRNAITGEGIHSRRTVRRDTAAAARPPVRNTPTTHRRLRRCSRLMQHPCRLRGTPTCRLQRATDRDSLILWAQTLDRNHPWTHLAHWTFRRDVPTRHALTASQRFERWLSAWRGTAGTASIRSALWSVERTSRDAVHGHALWVHTAKTCAGHWSGPRATSSCGLRTCREAMALSPAWRRLKESWYAHWGIMRCVPYDPEFKCGAERYVMKYILDENVLDWNVRLL